MPRLIPPLFIPPGGPGFGGKGIFPKFKQPKQFASSISASILGITGKSSQAGIASGLGLRPLQAPKKKKKKSKK